MIQKSVTIVNKLGLHARAASKFVKLAGRFESNILLRKGDRESNGKSIMGVMMLAASQGSELELVVEGGDEEQAMQALEALIADRFGEGE
ncbi:phosphocarrier protein HPr [Candidatus Tenderia electrophaga]|uniref:Phosphocarrier protein HPr n=1 Tax=Candidatus Tenderia electrophaga TaxID=1748243 RepID=A0A0S2T9D8_9GAMM|nr:phosphocarrier protein HPr [Candidatus Tenderia electrophaga]